MKVTSTEEYPHFRPWGKRKGFIHRGIEVYNVISNPVVRVPADQKRLTVIRTLWQTPFLCVFVSLSRNKKRVNYKLSIDSIRVSNELVSEIVEKIIVND